MTINENVEKGKATERKFQEWLDNHKIPYLYIHQEKETFSSFFREDLKGKRPDFLLLIPYFGFIFVDVKYKQLSQNQNYYAIDAQDAKKYSSLQRRFNINTWFVLSNEKVGYATWNWIPVSKVLECGVTTQISSRSKELFFPIPKSNFIQVAGDDSLSRLFSKLFKED
jgi:hypothetical protein